MEPKSPKAKNVASQTYAFVETPAAAARALPSRSTSRATRRSLRSSGACSEGSLRGRAPRPRPGPGPSPVPGPPPPEPQPLRVRPASLRAQDVSLALTRVFRRLYCAPAIGAHASASLIRARGSDSARHEAFVDQLQQE